MTLTSPIITLTTDFGRDSYYVAAMKGVILSINPAVTIVDISHSVRAQNIFEGAFVLREATRWFAAGTIHVAVVDPGVGTARRIVCVERDGQVYIAPDNGLLSRVLDRTGGSSPNGVEASPMVAYAIENREYWLPDVSSTFHGRDIVAPVAAHLSLGVPPSDLGPLINVNNLHFNPWPEIIVLPNEIVGRIMACDSFGNVLTNIRASDLPRDTEWCYLNIHSCSHNFDGIVETYHHAAPGTPVALISSSGLLELAVVDDSAMHRLVLAIGDAVVVKW